MIWTLRILFACVCATMIGVATWAGGQVAVWKIPHPVIAHPWFIATLFDTYFAFLTFWAWLAYKETSNLARLAWLLAICLLGNIAIAGYMLIQLFRLPPTATMSDLLLRRKAAA